MNRKAADFLQQALEAQTDLDSPPAETFFHEALKADPCAWEVLYHRGHRSFDLDQYNNALIDFTAVLSLIDETDAAVRSEMYTMRGLCFRYLYLPGPAITDFDRALSLDNTAYYALVNRGYLHYVIGNDREAERDLRAVREDLDGDDEELQKLAEQATIYLACLYHVQGKKRKAAKLLKRYSDFM